MEAEALGAEVMVQWKHWCGCSAAADRGEGGSGCSGCRGGVEVEPVEPVLEQTGAKGAGAKKAVGAVLGTSSCCSSPACESPTR